MNIAFYAPLKPPLHPNPSGDRLMARLLMGALASAGHRVTLAARLRTWDGAGDTVRQRRLQQLGARIAERLIKRFRSAAAEARPDIWFTYHLYHKAPDWIGPLVADALAIPYVIAEASFAPKQDGGRWASGHRQARAAIARADAVVGLNRADSDCLLPLLAEPERLALLPPFLDTAACDRLGGALTRRQAAARLGLSPDVPWLIATARMRAGDKLRSFVELADALREIVDSDWRLVVVGDGAARPQVAAAFAALPAGRVCFAGQLSHADLFPLLRQCDLYVWPAVNEAYGMALMEAQACGLPVVAGCTGGVPDVVEHDTSGLLVPVHDTSRFAGAVRALLDDPRRRARLGRQARARIRGRHDIHAAAARLDTILSDARRVHAARCP